jgi:hypothetical protein
MRDPQVSMVVLILKSVIHDFDGFQTNLNNDLILDDLERYPHFGKLHMNHPQSILIHDSPLFNHYWPPLEPWFIHY